MQREAEPFGEYLEIDRPGRLDFALATDREEAPSRVTVTIAPDGDGSRLRLVHETGAPRAGDKDRTRSGWVTILEALERQLVGRRRSEKGLPRQLHHGAFSCRMPPCFPSVASPP